MENYKSVKGSGIYIIIMLTVISDILIIVIGNLVNSYEILVLLKLLFIVFNIYQLYYIVLYGTITYSIEKDVFKIKSIFGIKAISIPIDKIKSYDRVSGNINGIKLTGYASNKFALGKSIIDKIGATQMFVTSNENIYYLNTEEGSFGISPSNPENFQKSLINKGIIQSSWENTKNKNFHLYKQKKFIVLLLLISIIIIVITLNPMILYMKGKLSSSMPLSFDGKFTPTKYGTGRQFAIKQTIYGALNMAVLFCMYYASYFCSKYDKKAAYRYLYVALIIACTFLTMQIKILLTY